MANHFEFAWRTNDGLNLFGQCWEPDKDSQAIICLVHGIGEHSSRYKHVAEFLNLNQFTLITFDLRGHGESQGQRGHTPGYEFMMEDISCLLQEAEKRYPACPHFLYGHSMGGNLVLNYVLRRRPPLAGVVATSPWLRMGFKPPVWKMAFGKMLRSVRPAHTLSNELDLNNLTHDTEVIEQVKADPLNHNQITARLFFDFVEAGERALANASEFPVPLLLMQGTGDKLTSLEATKKFADSAGSYCILKIWDGLFHEIHNELEKDEVLNFLCDWIKKTI